MSHLSLFPIFRTFLKLQVVVHERIQHRTVEEWIDIPVPQPQEEIVHVPVKDYQDRHHHVEAGASNLSVFRSKTSF